MKLRFVSTTALIAQTLLTLKAWPAMAAVTAAPGSAPLSGECSIKSLAPAPALAARGRVVTLSGGRTITLIGQDHGARDSYETIESTVTTPVADLPKADFRSNLQYQVNPAADPDETDPKIRSDEAHTREVTREAQQDMSFLKAYLASKSNAGHFVGVEGTAQAVATRLEIAARVTKEIHSGFEARGLVNDPLEEQTKLFAFGAPVRLALVDKSVRDRLFGFVAPAVSDRVAAAVREAEQAKLTLAREAGGAGLAKRVDDELHPWDLAASVSDTFATRGYVTYNPESDDAKISDALKAKVRPAEWARVQPYLAAKLSLLRASKTRDRSDARSLMAKNSSGILFVGRAHLDSVTAILRANCLADQKRAGGSPAAAPARATAPAAATR